MERRPFEFDGVVRFTRVGGAYLFATLVIGFAALNTGNNSLYIGLSLLLSTLLLSGIASKDGLRKIQLSFVGMEDAWAGRPTRGVLRVRNVSSIWNVRDIIIVAPTMARPSLVTEVRRRSSVDAEVEFLFPERGRAELTTVDLYTRYPFGLFLKKRRVRLEGSTIVFPRLLDQSVDAHSRREMRGEIEIDGRQGSGSDLFGFREYAVGDSLREIHWKKSASIGRWIMKEHQSEAGHMLILLVDPVLPSHALRERFEAMISEVATLIHDAIQSERDVVLHIAMETWSTRVDPSARTLFEALALLEPATSALLPAVGTQAVVFSLRETYASRPA